MENWSRKEVCGWLERIGLREDVGKFATYQVDGAMLLDITDNDLRTDIGITNSWHRWKILHAVQQYKSTVTKPLYPWVYSPATKRGLSVFGWNLLESGLYIYNKDICTTFSSSLRVHETVYIVGGQDKDQGLLDQVCTVTLHSNRNSCVVRSRASMHLARSCPALCLLNAEKMLAAGGYVEAKEPYAATSICEQYRLEADVWEPAPSLTEPKALATLCRVGTFVYCIGGNNYYKHAVYTGRIEKLSLESKNLQDKHWEVVVVKEPQGLWVPLRSCLSVSVSEHEILICGGNSQGTKLNKVWLFDTDKQTLNMTGSLGDVANFESAEAVQYDNSIYCVDTLFRVHVCDLRTRMWALIPADRAFAHLFEAEAADDITAFLARLAAEGNNPERTLGEEAVVASLDQDSPWVYSPRNKIRLTVFKPDVRTALTLPFTQILPCSFMGNARVGNAIALIGGESNTKEPQNQNFWVVPDFEHRVANVFERSPMPTPRSCVGIGVYRKRLYCVGGYASNTVPYPATAICERYSVLQDRWDLMRPMPQARALLGKCVLEHFMYVFGGSNFWPESEILSSVVRLDLDVETADWMTVQLLDPGQTWCPVQSISAQPISEQTVLLFGGSSRGHAQASVFVFDNRNGSIRKVENNMRRPTACEYGSTLMFESRVYLLDDEESLHTCDLATFSWALAYLRDSA